MEANDCNDMFDKSILRKYPWTLMFLGIDKFKLKIKELEKFGDGSYILNY